MIGVELGGALKNVLAIACGISDGLGFGSNGRAALITRGLDEITRLAVASGANPLTMAGLAGVGDIVLTCTGDLSRNRSGARGCGADERAREHRRRGRRTSARFACTPRPRPRPLSVGLRIGKGEKLEDIIKSMSAVAEGVLTSRSAYHFAQKKGIECPVLEGIYRVVNEGADPIQVVTETMSRPLIPEVNPAVAEAAHQAEVVPATACGAK